MLSTGAAHRAVAADRGIECVGATRRRHSFGRIRLCHGKRTGPHRQRAEVPLDTGGAAHLFLTLPAPDLHAVRAPDPTGPILRHRWADRCSPPLSLPTPDVQAP